MVASGPVTGPFRFRFSAAFYRSRLFLVGESHGSAAPHLFDLALFEKVARRTGLRNYLAECDPVQGAALDRVVRTGDDAGPRAVFDFWSGEGSQWGSRSYEEKMRGLRAVALRLGGGSVRVHGLDAIQVTGPLVKLDGSADLAAAAPARQVTVYDLAARGSPYRTSPDFTRVRTSIGQDFEPDDPAAPATDYVRYLGVVRGSDWAGARAGALDASSPR